MSADLLDQLAAYGAQEREARQEIDVGVVMHDVPRPADADDAAPVAVSARRPDRGRAGRDRLPVVTLTAAAMVVAVVGLIAVLAAVRDGPSEAPAPGSASISPPLPPVGLFRVNADAAAYWRLTSLVEYDGERFRLPRRSLEQIDGVEESPGGSTIVRQQVQILALDGQLVPAAAEPFQASGSSGAADVVLSLSRDTDTLVAGQDLAPGDLFTIVSSRPQPSADELRAATTEAPDPLLLALPDDLPSEFGALVAEVTGAAATSYDAALALQDWFRAGFVHRTDATGHSIGELERFLEDRAGPAEQFAATFAVMGRTIGLPTRVAEGFTTGVLDQHGWYSVTTAQSHTWPEVWFDGVGWLPFEPTPGRGIPGAESYTGVPAQQDERTATSPP